MTDKSGPVFPTQPLGQDGLPEMSMAYGLSLRDYFAAQAMPAVLQHIEQILLTSPLAMESDMKDAPSQELELHVLESVAFHAYALADAMLKQKEQ